jgi:hypothetical protein
LIVDGDPDIRKKGKHMRRAWVLGAALTVLVSGASTVGLAGQAWAGSKIGCTTITGSVATGITISGCTGGNTGGGSQKMSATLLQNGGTIKWLSGSTTTLSPPVLTPISAKKCPGYVKGGTTIALDKASGSVTADTGDGIKIPGKFSGEICINTVTLTILSLVKPMKVT